MNQEQFEQELNKKLKDLTHKQQVKFAWLCSLRALPYLFFLEPTKLFEQDEIREIFESIDSVVAHAELYGQEPTEITQAFSQMMIFNANLTLQLLIIRNIEIDYIFQPFINALNTAHPSNTFTSEHYSFETALSTVDFVAIVGKQDYSLFAKSFIHAVLSGIAGFSILEKSVFATG